MKTRTTEINIKDGKITGAFSILYKEEEKCISCYIPGFDISYSVMIDDKSKIKSRGKNMVVSFFNFWVKNQGMKSFFLELHKLGFRSEKHDFVLRQLLNNKLKDAKFGNKTEVEDNQEVLEAELAF